MSKRGIKIVTIGGGSSYTPELMEGFINRYEQMPIREIWLVDVAEGQERLEIIGKMAERMWDASPYKVTIKCTLDRREALLGADFVTTQFRVGHLEARIKDERIPFSYGLLGQETNGAGGIFNALRTIPVALEIIEDMRELCPNAWMINFTNPSGMVTEAIVKYGKWKKVIGLCNVPISSMTKEPLSFDSSRLPFTYRFAGINHFHWHRVFDHQGKEITSEIIENMKAGQNNDPQNIHKEPFFDEQLEAMNVIPCGYHRYYYRQEEMLKHGLAEYETIGTRAEQVSEIEDKLFDLYKDTSLSKKPELLSKRGGAHYSTAACDTIVSIYADKQSHMVVLTQNNGAIPDLELENVVEVSSLIGALGASPLAFGRLKSAERGWLQLMKNMELCVCEAAVTGDYGMVLQAFVMNPLIPAGETAKRVLDELMIAHKKYLPQFEESIKALEAKGITIKDQKSDKLSKIEEV